MRELREQERERQLQEIDRREAEETEKIRQETLERAQRLLEEDTDRMKTLKSKTMLVDTLIERDNQLQWKKRKQEMEKAREKHYYQQMLITMQKEKERDEAELAEKKRKADEAARMYIIIIIYLNRNAEQLALWEERMMNEILEDQKDGEEMIRKAQQDLEEERRTKQRIKEKYIEDGREMVRANKELEDFKRMQDEQMNNEEKKIAEWAKKKEDQEMRRKVTLEKRQKDRLNRTNFLISRATEALKARLDDSERVLQKQIKEQNEKDENEELMKEQKRREEWDAIVKSRNYQLEEKERIRLEQIEKDKEFAAAWRKQNKQMLEEDYKEKMRIYERNRAIAEEQRKQMERQEEYKRKVREEEILNEEANLKRGDDEDERVMRRATALLDKYEKAGKNTIPLRTALLPKDELTASLRFAT